jgi:hypothetical protein
MLVDSALNADDKRRHSGTGATRAGAPIVRFRAGPGCWTDDLIAAEEYAWGLWI